MSRWEPDLTAAPDGYALRFGGEVLATYPTWDEAVAALKRVREASVALDGLFAAQG